MGATNREWTEKITNLERQVKVFYSIYLSVFLIYQLNELNDKLKTELDSNIRLKKQNQELQKTFTHLEYEYNESNTKYQELNNIKLKIERDFLMQQSFFEQEKNAKYVALEKIQELEGIRISNQQIKQNIFYYNSRR